MAEAIREACYILDNPQVPIQRHANLHMHGFTGAPALELATTWQDLCTRSIPFESRNTNWRSRIGYCGM